MPALAALPTADTSSHSRTSWRRAVTAARLSTFMHRERILRQCSQPPPALTAASAHNGLLPDSSQLRGPASVSATSWFGGTSGSESAGFARTLAQPRHRRRETPSLEHSNATSHQPAQVAKQRPSTGLGSPARSGGGAPTLQGGTGMPGLECMATVGSTQHAAEQSKQPARSRRAHLSGISTDPCMH